MDRDGRRDPVERAAGDGADLYDVAAWEPRTWRAGFSVGLYRWLGRIGRLLLVFTALLILVAQFALTGLAAVANPFVGTFILLSVVPALLLAAYVWRTDVTMREPLGLLVGTFLLGVLFASFAAVLNTVVGQYVRALPVVGLVLFFYLVVGPVEETVKWLAVRLYAYRDDRFHAVIDGAVYGAMAGLGFATIENTLYIGQEYVTALQAGSVASPIFQAALPTAFVRTFAGPGHVIYSAFAGYYLGLAKFNPENAGPIAVKGLVIAAFIHGTYNTIVTYVGPLAGLLEVSVSPAVLFLGFVVVYDGIFGYALLRKLSRYRKAYRSSDAGDVSTSSETAIGAGEPDEEGEPPFEGPVSASDFQWADEHDEP